MSMVRLSLSGRIYYEITSRCNLFCAHCSDLTNSNNTILLQADELLTFHRKILKLGITESVVTGGEPSLHPQFYTIVKGLAEMGPVVITTNGVAFSPELFLLLLQETPNLFLQVSLDGSDSNVNDVIRGRGSFQAAFKLLKKISQAMLGRQVGLSFTILRSNHHQICQILELAKKLDLASVHFPTLLPPKSSVSWNEISLSPEEQIKVEELLVNKINQLRSGLLVTVNRVTQVLSRVLDGPMGDCWFNLTLKVNPEGMIFHCAAAARYEWVLGKMDDKRITDKLMDNARDQANCLSKHHKLPLKKCSSCSMLNLCQGRFCASCPLFGPMQKDPLEHYCFVFRNHYYQLSRAIKQRSGRKNNYDKSQS